MDKFHRTLPKTLNEAKVVFGEIEKLWEKNLKDKGVKLPSFGNHTCYQLIYLYCNLKKLVHKDDVQKWDRETWIPDVGDSQIRHLGAQAGFNLYKGGEVDPNGNLISGGNRSGYAVLWDLDNVCPHWKQHRIAGVKAGDWESIKKLYDYRCATCGSPEGHRNFKNTSLITKLQQGHMNNETGNDLVPGNIIPQCLECNQAYRDTVNFNEKGMVVSLSTPELAVKSSKSVRQQILDILRKDPELT